MTFFFLVVPTHTCNFINFKLTYTDCPENLKTIFTVMQSNSFIYSIFENYHFQSLQIQGQRDAFIYSMTHRASSEGGHARQVTY